jgi:hypothetical protein
MTTPALDRAGFDALVQRRVMALATSAPERPANVRRERQQEAQLLEAAATSFADAVDRSELRNNGQPVPYGEAVVITGDAGVVVVRSADYRREPIYWEALAGEVDSLTRGPDLLADLLS